MHSLATGMNFSGLPVLRAVPWRRAHSSRPLPIRPQQMTKRNSLPKSINEAKWRTSSSDVHVLLNRRTIQAFMKEVVLPALSAVDAEIDRIDRSSNDAERAFAGADMRAVKHKTIEAFLLSTHSIWERQLRRWLASAARDTGFDVTHIQKRIVRGNWADLKVALEEVVHLPVAILDSGPHLDLAQLLANACRHGDGGSAEDLSKQWPELWPEYTAVPPPFGLFPSKAFQSFELARLSPEVLQWMVATICAFWEDIEYIRMGGFAAEHDEASSPTIRQYLSELSRARALRQLALPFRDAASRS